MPIDWLSGKLPMSSVEEIIYNNFNKVSEKQFVHSTFYYERQNGSQLIADRLSEGLNLKYNTCIDKIKRSKDKWEIDGILYDIVIFCGNIKDLHSILQYESCIYSFSEEINDLQYHGTTATFCEIDSNPYSWIYLPSTRYQAHRIICTGNFSPTNNNTALQTQRATGALGSNRITATIEFTDAISKAEIIDELKKIPLHPKYITHKYNQYTYPIQSKGTREMIASLKQKLATKHFYLTGRFADWEYYNMDAAMAAAMKTIKWILS
jgi:UDP-galactopyranose mutase